MLIFAGTSSRRYWLSEESQGEAALESTTTLYLVLSVSFVCGINKYFVRLA
jgi:hypothetical protein